MFLLDPLLIKWLIDQILPKKDFHLLFAALAGFLGIYISRLALSAFAGLITFSTVQNLVSRMRLGILEQMNRLSADYHETTPVGEKLYRMEQDVDQVAELGSGLVPYALQTIFNTVFVVATMQGKQLSSRTFGVPHTDPAITSGDGSNAGFPRTLDRKSESTESPEPRRDIVQNFLYGSHSPRHHRDSRVRKLSSLRGNFDSRWTRCILQLYGKTL